MQMGTFQRLMASRDTANGLYFTDGESEILLPRSEVPMGWVPGIETELFLYRDSEDRPTATRKTPLAQLGQTAVMDVAEVGPTGAFLQWGLLKDLLVPHAEQAIPLVKGQSVLVLVQLDERTDRLYGTTKLSRHLSRDLSGLTVGQQVSCTVWKLHELGWMVIVENRWQGLIYRNEARILRPGEQLQGWISELREGKLDIRLRPQGFASANPDAEDRIMAALSKAGGRLALNDKSNPDEIFAVLGLSKKAFKTACGTLYKKGLIELGDAVTSKKTDESSS
jgi:predicted RNA-binding protein (virulence factor B family)